MKTYSFDCFDFEGAVCKVHLIRCPDDRHALAEARAMLSVEPSCFAIEVWREDGRVGRLDYRAAVA